MSTEHQSKRLTTNQLPTPDDPPDRYLDTVTDDSLRTVLRFLSNRPRHKNWHAYISPLSVNTALDVGGALRRAASLEFGAIGGDDGIPLYGDADASTFRSLVHRLHLHRLVLELGGGRVLTDVLLGCGAELRELDLDAKMTVVPKADIVAISTHCKRLSSLAIRGHRVEGTLAPIWRSLGSTLTRIYISCYCSRYGIGDVISVPDLVQHCVNLRHVDVEELNHAVANVLIALGSRIRVLVIVDKIVPSCVPWREVYSACTNLEAIHLGLDCSAQAIDVLSLMRTKIVSLKLHDTDRLMPDEDRFFSVLSTCSMLKEVDLRVWKLLPEALLRKLFGSLKSVTTLTCVMNQYDVNPAKDIIDVIACNLTNLESLTMWTVSLKGEDVDALFDLPHLKSVTLRPACYNISISKHLQCAVEVVKRLKNCAQLVQLEIHGLYIKNRYPLIAEAARYERTDFDMFIGGSQYRTW